MRTLATLAVGALVLAAAGCAPQKPMRGESGQNFVRTATGDGLEVQMVLSQRYLLRGETLDVTVTAKNVSDKDMTIEARSGALAQVAVSRTTAVGWEQIKLYPESAIMVMKPWTLKAGESRKFPLSIQVAPDWPTGEQLKVEAYLNGKPKVKPSAYVEVFTDKAECDRRRVY